ncbi:MAG: NYN domain-containing protein [Chloroflexota bacterium]|nr:NYN domain-containing protein [Chloroflexota bacterium]
MAKVAILIDGGYFLKRLPSVRSDIYDTDPIEVAGAIRQLVRNHLSQLNNIATNFYSLLYRCFYYDALPYSNKGQKPITRRPINFATSEMATFRNGLFDALREQSNFALRLGEVRKPSKSSWTLKPSAQKRLLRGDIDTSGLSDEDFIPDLHQKGVDMRIGLDIASITLKRQADTITRIW